MYLYIYSIIIAILYVYIYRIIIALLCMYIYICICLLIILYISYMYVCLHMFQNLLQPGMRHHNPQRIIALRSCPRRGMSNLPGVPASKQGKCQPLTCSLVGKTPWLMGFDENSYNSWNLYGDMWYYLIKSLMLDGISIVCITLYANNGKIKIPTSRKDSMQFQDPIFTNVRKHAFPST